MRHLLSVLLAATCACASFTVRAAARENTLLDSGWRFKLGDPSGAEKSGFNDADWQPVSIPHCWGWQQAQQGKMYHRGPGWYRRDLDIGPPKKGRRYFLRFGAAGSVADVYLNGQFLGEHRGAFGAFCFEITKALDRSGTNLLAVRVSNAPEPDIAPLSGDFPVYGGLYRRVHLIETADTCFTPTDHASPGVAWLQSKVSDAEAVLDVTAQISNGTRRKPHLELVAKVLDAAGREVAREAEAIGPAPEVTAPYWLRVAVPRPHLWDGRKDPYLYRAVVELRSGGEVVDSVEQPLGLRFYRVDPEKGFFLNGKPYPIHGVCRHQDRWNKGWAISHADQRQDVSLILDMGATAVRCAHYQQSSYFYSLCDKAGLLVWAELPQVDEIGAGPRFAETSRNQLLDLIRQNINHPSIFVWSLFNELRPGHPDPHRLLQDLSVVAHGEDPTRPTIAATCTGALPEMNKIPDLLGWNIYPGWYPGWGSKDDFTKLVREHRYDSRHGGICLSEYGAGANVFQHQENPPQPVADSQWHPEEWQAILHEAAWAQLKTNRFVWGTFVWNMFDFTSYWRHEGGVPGRNDKGLVTADRKIKKDAFYFYMANWSDEPVLYITSRRFTQRTNAVTDVKIYSNAQDLTLRVNGVEQGAGTSLGDAVFVWKNVRLQPGENRIQATARRDGQALEDACAWTLAGK